MKRLDTRDPQFGPQFDALLDTARDLSLIHI